MDDTKLIRSAQQGDLDAFNRLILKHQEMAFNLAYRMLGDGAAAADATQQAFIAAYKGLKGYRGGSLRAWIMRIVTNQCYDELRRLKRHPTTRLEQYNPENNEEIDTPSWLADNSNDPEDAYTRTELDRAIQHCLEGLSEDYRAVVILVDVQGCDYQETAHVIQKPIGTVKSRLARARLRLQDCLQQFKELLPAQFRLISEGSM